MADHHQSARRRLHTLHTHLQRQATTSSSTTTTTQQPQKKLLAGIIVVELATVIAAPACCGLLADHGAEVIKIEDPRSPDIARSWGRGDDSSKTADPALQSAPGGGGSAFTQINRGKRAIALNPTTPQGKAMALKLIGTADIFVTNVRQKSLVKMGLDYDSVAKLFPKLIYGQLSAWGRQGKMADDPGYDFGAFWAHTGVQDIIRSSDDASMPRFPGGVGDYTTAHQLFGGLMTALYQREREGVGQLVDASLLRAGLWFLSHALSQFAGGTSWANSKSGEGTATGGIRETTELGQRRTPITNAPFRCKDDRWIQLMGLEQARHLPATLKALGLKNEDIELKNTEGKQDWRRATIVCDKIFLTKTADEWGEILSQHGVWWKRINRFDEMFEDDQANQAGSFVEIPGVRHKLVGNPIILSKANHIPTKGAPKFGEDTIDVLQSLGYSPLEIEEFKKLGVISYPERK